MFGRHSSHPKNKTDETDFADLNDLKAAAFRDVFCRQVNPPMDRAFIDKILRDGKAPAPYVSGAKVLADHAVLGIVYPVSPDGQRWGYAAAVFQVRRDNNSAVSSMTPVGKIICGKECGGPDVARLERYKLTRELFDLAPQMIVANNANRKQARQDNTSDSDIQP